MMKSRLPVLLLSADVFCSDNESGRHFFNVNSIVPWAFSLGGEGWGEEDVAEKDR